MQESLTLVVWASASSMSAPVAQLCVSCCCINSADVFFFHAVHLRGNEPTIQLLMCQNCFFKPNPDTIPFCPAKSYTFNPTKCKWGCAVRALGSTALLPRKRNLKVCFQLSAETQGPPLQRCHWQSCGEIDGENQQCPLNAGVRFRKAFYGELSISKPQAINGFTQSPYYPASCHLPMWRLRGETPAVGVE